jgi:HlyD family secretion protein
MNVSAKFVVGEVKDAITVPTVCVISRRGQAGVFVPGPNSEPTFKPVKTGPTVGKDIVIMSGLSKGEKVYQGLSRDQLAKEGYGGRMGGPGGPGGPPTGPGSALRMGGGGGGGRRGMGP